MLVALVERDCLNPDPCQALPQMLGGCHAVVGSANGDSYEMNGAGGTFAHRSSNGDLLDTGVWITNELDGFDSYGIAPGALPQKGQAFGKAIGPKGLRMPSGSMPTGGLAVFRIRLLPNVGAINDCGAASELRFGKRATGTLGGRDSAQTRTKRRRILAGA